MLLALFTFCVGIVIGAYSHKWLAKETGAPAEIVNVGSLPATAVQVAKDVAKKV